MQVSVHDVDVLMIGAGPSNLALAVALEEGSSPKVAANAMILEQYGDVKWHRNLLLPWTRSQVSYVKDLVTLRNPRSRFTFLNFLHERGELDEFVNLGTFNPFRWQLSTYQQWVADTLEHVQVRYGVRAERILPIHDEDGAMLGFAVPLSDGDTILCRDLVFGAGRDAFVPEVFHSLPAERVVHSTEYGSRIGDTTGLARPGRPLRPVVIGGAQSAAEMFMALHQDAPGSSPMMLLRSVALKDYQTSKFVNELFYPSFVDAFFAMSEEVRTKVLDEMRLTNYAGLAPPFLEELYTMIYQQKMLGQPVSIIRGLTEVVGARVESVPGGGAEVVLEVRDLKFDGVEQVRCDALFLGTSSKTVVLDPAEIRKYFEQALLSTKPMGATLGSYSTMVVSDTTVVVTGLDTVTGVRDGKPFGGNGRVTFVVAKRGSDWQIVHFHRSAMPR